jgi:hypothetical protein
VKKKIIIFAFAIFVFFLSLKAVLAFNLNPFSSLLDFLFPSSPEIISAKVEPIKVEPSDWMEITVEARDKYGITSVKADMAGIETIELKLVSGNKFEGTWKATWFVHSVEVGKSYTAKIIVENEKGKVSTADVEFHDDPVFCCRRMVNITESIWAYRKPITINNTGNANTLTDYQVLVTNPIYNETGLVGSWHFNEGSGTIAYDSSGNNNNGNLVNDPTWVDGKFGKALSFDGVNDYVEVPYSASLNPSEFSISVWARVDGGQGTWRSVITSRDSGPFRGYMIYAGADNKWQFWIGVSTSWLSLYGPDVILGQWIHIVATYSGGIMRLYVNGSLYNTTSGTLALNTIRPLRIGAGQTEGAPAFFFNGLIDEVRIYNRALSDAEIQALYQAKARLDYGDIRFTDSDGSTLLNYWQEADGKFWVKVPNIPASSTKTIYVYYGNPSATSLSNGDNTFEFFDDFNGTSLDTSKWVAYANSYSVSNSILRVNIGGIERTSAFSFNIQDGYMVETKVIHYALAAGYGGVLPEVASSPYTTGGNANADATILYMRGGGSATVYYWIGNGASASYNVANDASTGWTSSNNVWYITGVSVRGGEVKLWRDGTAIVTVTGITWYKDLKYVKLGSFHRDAAYDIQDTGYDWIRVRKYTSPEPTTSVGDEEPAVTGIANVILDTQNLISAGKMRSDCGDIRFTDSRSFDSALWTRNFSYNITNCNSASTQFLVNVSSLSPTIGTTFYVYYGNPAVTSISKPISTFGYSTTTLLPEETWIRISGGSSNLLITGGGGNFKIK